jgi:predicted nucleotidyltransferase
MKQKLIRSQVQETVWKFINEFRDLTVDELSGKIDFIIIYGSAVRCEFVPGKSDVDILVQIFKKSDREEVEKRVAELFWKVAKKYPELQFEKSLSVSRNKKKTLLTGLLEKLEKGAFLYVPVFVFAKGEIDWVRGELHSKNPLIKIGQGLLIPQRSVFLRFKQEGEVLYGRDIRKEIKIRLTVMDRLRVGAAPQFLSFIGFFVSCVTPKKGLGYAVKALLYQVDALLTALADYKKMERSEKIAKNEKMLLQDYTALLHKITRMKLDYTKGALRPSDFKLFSEAIELKCGEKKLGYFSTIWFCLKANWFIVRSNARAIAYLVIRKVFRK